MTTAMAYLRSCRSLLTAMALLLVGCGSPPAPGGAAAGRCEERCLKNATCSRGGGGCVFACPDGGSFDMAHAPMANPDCVGLCGEETRHGRADYWNAFYACYLDGNTMCSEDEKSCQAVAFMAVAQPRPIDATYREACTARCKECSGGTFCSSDAACISLTYDDASVMKATACFQMPCEQVNDCLGATFFK